MVAKRAFVSFDYDHDNDLYGDLVEQSRRPDSPFRITDWSIPSAVHDSLWKWEARKRIDQVDVVIFICGVNTHSARGVEAEMSITQSAGKRYFLLKGRRRHTCSKPKNARLADTIQPWTWSNIAQLLGGS